MKPITKLALILGGYVAACLVAGFISYIHELLTQSAAAQAASGMYAFGDLILFVGIFLMLALFPTGLGLYFLVRKFLPR